MNPTEPVVAADASSEVQAEALRAAVEAKLQEILPAINGLGTWFETCSSVAFLMWKERGVCEAGLV